MSLRHGILALAFVAGNGPAYAQKEYGFDNTKPSGQPYLTPAESLKRMKVADGFEVKLFAAEPMVINPIAFTIDERGRVWVVESFEYPRRTPAGKMPRDRIVILEDTDGDGVADKRTVFAEGKDFPERFDLASGIEVGYGGVFLGASPHLWFIENKNDKPGKFTKLLSGFGSQDTHETLNTFQWGPDGWLYGLHGIFTQSEVKNLTPPAPLPEAGRGEKNLAPPSLLGKGDGGLGSSAKLNAGVWRYHPRTHKFEVFAEGTSNPWGWDYRNTDGQMILCCCVIPHLFHIVPGGIYKRQAGTSENPYAYGYLNEICDHTFHKESGWAHAGLLSLDTPIMPEQYRDSVIFGSIHGCSIKRNTLKRNGSTFTASRADDFLVSGDKNFRPLNLRWGPNADIFVSDWHDQNPCHQARPEDWDYEHGRIYRIVRKRANAPKTPDLAIGFTPDRFFATLADSDGLMRRILANHTGESEKALSPWWDRTLRRLLYEQPEATRAAFDKGIRQFKPVDVDGPRALYVWLVPGLANEAELFAAYDLPIRINAHGMYDLFFRTRLEIVRMLGQRTAFSSNARQRIAAWATEDLQPEMSQELISATPKIDSFLPEIKLHHSLMQHKENATDPVIPLMLWLAYEPKLAANAKAELAWLQANAPGNPLITDHILPRAMRRLVATGKSDDLNACIAFVAATNDTVRLRALEGLAVALQGRQLDAPPAWAALAPTLDSDSATKELAQKLAVSFRDPAAGQRALGVYHDINRSSAERAEAVRQLAQLKPPTALSVLISATRQEADPAVRLECARALAQFDGPNVSREILSWWKRYSDLDRAAMVNVLAGNKAWAKDLLAAVAKGDVAKADLNNNVILRMTAFKDRSLNAEIERVWGKLRDTPAEIAKLIDTMRGELEKAPGSFAKGKAIFDAQCAKCHQFDGRGFTVGPALDGAGRDLDYLLVNILDPNRVVGQPYFVRRVLLKKGTVEEGLLHEEDAQKIALKGENDAVRTISKSDIESIDVIERSMMPEGLGYSMTTQDFRDLVRYVMANPPIIDWQLAGPFGEAQKNVPHLDGLKWERRELGASGRMALPKTEKRSIVYLAASIDSANEFRAPLQFEGGGTVRAWFNGREVQPSAPVDVKRGTNTLLVEVRYAGEKPIFAARLLDPERKLTIR